MKLTELELENLLFEKGEIKVNGVDVYLSGRQYQLGEHRADILCNGDDGKIYIFELKSGIIDGNALSQILFYKSLAKEMFKKELANKQDPDWPEKIICVLIGSDITKYMSLALNEVDDLYFINYNISFDYSEQNFSINEHTKQKLIKNKERYDYGND